MRKMLFQLLLIIVLSPTILQAAIRTVGPGKTYTTIAAAEAASQDGDTIQIYSGTYNEAVTFDVPNLTIEVPQGESVIAIGRDTSGYYSTWTIHAAGVTVQAHSPNNAAWTGVTRPYGTLAFPDPTLNGYAILTGSHTRAIQITYAGDNCKIFGVEITGRSDYWENSIAISHIRNGLSTAGDATEIAYCYMYQLTRNPVGHQSGVPLLWVHHNRFEAYSYGNAVMLAGKAGQEDAYYVRARIDDNFFRASYTSDGVQSNASTITTGIQDVTAIVIRRNVIYGMGENCIDMKGAKFVLIQGNYLGGAIGDSNGPWDGTQLNAGGTIGAGSGQSSSDYIVRNNVIIDGSGGVGNKDRIYSYHNTFVNLARDYRGANQTTALDTYSYGGTYSTKWDYNGFLNNIVVNSVGGLAVVDFGSEGSANRTLVNYNLYHNPDYNGGVVRFGSKGHVQQFLTTAQWQGYGFDLNSIIADPLLNLVNYQPTGDPSNHDYSLRAGSPAIDAGTWLCTVASVAGNVITISEAERARMFFDGFGIPGEVGDTIYDDDGNSAVVVSIDRTANTLRVDNATGFDTGDGITVADYNGAAPDLGAIEYGTSGPTPPSPPEPIQPNNAGRIKAGQGRISVGHSWLQ